MSSVKIVFSNVVGGSAVASQIRELVNQLNDDCVFNIGEISVCVDSLDHVKSHDHRSFYERVDHYELTIHGRVMEKPVNKPQWVNADITPPTEPGYYWVLVDANNGEPAVCELDAHLNFWDDNFGGYDTPGTRYIKINKPE